MNKSRERIEMGVTGHRVLATGDPNVWQAESDCSQNITQFFHCLSKQIFHVFKVLGHSPLPCQMESSYTPRNSLGQEVTKLQRSTQSEVWRFLRNFCIFI